MTFVLREFDTNGTKLGGLWLFIVDLSYGTSIDLVGSALEWKPLKGSPHSSWFLTVELTVVPDTFEC